MHSRSAAFDAAVSAGGRPVCVVDLNRVDVATGAVTAVALDVAVLGPSISIDGSAAVRRSFKATAIDSDGSLIPLLPTDDLAPYGVEAAVRSGFLLDDGSTELIPVGVFRLGRTEASSSGAIPLTGKDRSVVVDAAGFEMPYTIAAGTNVATAVHDLVDAAYPGLTYSLAVTAETVGLTVYQEASTGRWTAAQALAASAGLEVFFDAAGAVVLRPVPDPTTDSIVWEYAPGSANLLIDSSYVLDSDSARNVAIVLGEASGDAAPIRGTAEITDPASPLYPGRIGRRPVRLVTQLVTTQAQADDAAIALLQREAGGSEQAAFRAAPHPAHEAGDVVRLADEELGLDVTCVLAAWTLDPSLLTEIGFTTSARRSAT